MAYEPTLESLRNHAVPGWYDDAKLGIFVHWGLYSVPGWAPVAGEYGQLIAKEGWTTWFAKNPYAEWYLNSIRIEDSPSQRHHVQTYGEGFSYDDFVPNFNEDIGAWNPGDWAELFRQAGAGYVVLTTKHHDGFLLWPSRAPNPVKNPGELAGAVRTRGMRLGLYYSGGPGRHRVATRHRRKQCHPAGGWSPPDVEAGGRAPGDHASRQAVGCAGVCRQAGAVDRLMRCGRKLPGLRNWVVSRLGVGDSLPNCLELNLQADACPSGQVGKGR